QSGSSLAQPARASRPARSSRSARETPCETARSWWWSPWPRQQRGREPRALGDADRRVPTRTLSFLRERLEDRPARSTRREGAGGREPPVCPAWFSRPVRPLARPYLDCCVGVH